MGTLTADPACAGSYQAVGIIKTLTLTLAYGQPFSFVSVGREQAWL